VLATYVDRGQLEQLRQSTVSASGRRVPGLHLKLYQKLYAPLTAAIRDPVPADNQILTRRQTKLDRLYVAVDQALAHLAEHLGIAA
jgi:hypothetical protein